MRGPQILICHCAYAQVVPVPVRERVLERLRQSGARFEAVADLCELAARKDPVLKDLAEAENLRIAACYPRAVKGLFALGEAPLLDSRATILNMRVQEADTVVAGLLGSGADTASNSPPAGGGHSLTEDIAGAGCIIPASNPAGWLPWFPVIDYDRCTHCAQCLSFCLFGVYGLSADRKVQVQNPALCKPNCPACARVCPEVAIQFPKCKTSPINGDEVSLGDVQREKLKVDISALLGGDAHELLRERGQRGQERFSKERDAGASLLERRKYLAKLVEQGDIPPEVLMSLPLPEGLQSAAFSRQIR